MVKKNRNLMCVTAASEGSSLFTQYRPFAILEPKNQKTDWLILDCGFWICRGKNRRPARLVAHLLP
jgi:hypothetical protein